MELKHIELNTDDMTFDEVNDLIQTLRRVRERKSQLQSRVHSLHEMCTNMKFDGMSFVSRYTGEVLNPDDWALYDDEARAFYPGKGEE